MGSILLPGGGGGGLPPSASTSNTIKFDKPEGYIHGTWSAPITGALVIDDTGATEGVLSVIIWQGSSNPAITGGAIEQLSGEITVLDTYSIYISYIDGRFNINIFNVANDTEAPQEMTIITVTT